MMIIIQLFYIIKLIISFIASSMCNRLYRADVTFSMLCIIRSVKEITLNCSLLID